MALPYDLATMINSLRETCSSLADPETGSLNTPQARILEPYTFGALSGKELRLRYPNLEKAGKNSPPIQFNVFDHMVKNEDTPQSADPKPQLEFTKGSISTIEEGQSLHSSVRSKRHGIFSRLLRQHTKSDSSDLSLSSGDLEAEEDMVAGSEEEEDANDTVSQHQVRESLADDNESDQSYVQNLMNIDNTMDSEFSDDLDSDEFLSDFEYGEETSPAFNTFSYSKKKSSMSLRKPAPESLNLQTRKNKSSSVVNEPLRRNSRSFTSFSNAVASFSKQNIAPAQGKSNLTSLIKAKSESPLDYYSHVGSESGLAIKVYVTGKAFDVPELRLTVNPNSTVVEVIGYILRTLQRTERYSSLYNPNQWSLFLWDEDEESYDEFGILNRTRVISSYGADEFALVKSDDYRRNEKETPLPFEEEKEDDEVKLDLDEDYRQILTQITDTKTPFSAITLSNKQSSTLRRRDKEDMEVVESADEESLAEEDDDSDEDFNMPSTKPTVRKQRVRPRITLNTAAAVKTSDPKTPTAEGLSTGYQCWDVVRRHPFKNRQERSLAVDGTQIYILPFSDNRGSWYENAKTTSFNVGQIQKCKLSSKYPLHFKIVIAKHGGLKRYDLEATTISEARDIVNKINMLMQAYKAGLTKVY